MNAKLFQNGIAMWMVQVRFEELDQFEFVGTQFTVVIDVSKWCHEVSVKVLSGMPNPECRFIKSVETTF